MYNPELVGKMAREITKEWEIGESVADTFVYNMMNQYPDASYDFLCEKLGEVVLSSKKNVLIGIPKNKYELESWYHRFGDFTVEDMMKWKGLYGSFYDRLEVWKITEDDKKIICSWVI